MNYQRKLVPPVYMLLALLAMFGLHYELPLARLVTPPLSWLGLAPLLAGLGITAAAARAFSRAGTPIRPFERSTRLVTGGLYRYTRNPMYVGLTLILIGTWLLLGTASALLPIAVFIWIIQAGFIRGEERFLDEIFGEEYRGYKSRVRRWI
ncbi:MAG TPA: isoprenylcysteine carboxylmethyltransferase family protein [Steroidobacteraceae bacterium]|nr:isoprenylcysteine carboxylmethyltransferase family protein [Steroidobacteraceae bacterium]